MRLLIVLALSAALALSVGAATASAGGGNSANAKLCQKDGWQSLYTGNGATFASEEDCVSYAAQGGTLYPAVADVSTSGLLSYNATTHELTVRLFVSNAGPSSVTVAAGWGLKVGSTVLYTDPAPILAPGQTATVFATGFDPTDPTEFPSCSSGCTVEFYGQVERASDPTNGTPVHDPDSTPGNYSNGFTGPAVEDDEFYSQITIPDPGSA